MSKIPSRQKAPIEPGRVVILGDSGKTAIVLTEWTYTKNSQRPVPAKRGLCSRCKRTALIVTVNGWGSFCGRCAKRLERDWKIRMKKPCRVTQAPFELHDNGR